MNKKELKVEMVRYGDTGETLSKAIGVVGSTLSNKMSETNDAEFTQSEIAAIKERYSLSAERVAEIFFA